MKVVQIFTVPLSLGFIEGQVEYLTARGIELHCIASPGPELTAFGEGKGIKVHGIEMSRRITPARDIRALLLLKKSLLGIDPVLVHSSTPKGGLLGMLAATLARVPVRVYQIRGLPFMSAKGVRRMASLWAEWVSCSLAHSVLCNSESLRDVAVRAGLCRESKIKVLAGGSSNGVDARARFSPERISMSSRVALRHRFGIPQKSRIIGFVGRLVKDKGVVELIEAWARVKDLFPDEHLLVVGDYEAGDAVPPETRRLLEEDPRVHVTGWIDDPASTYAVMDILVLPSYREGFPNVPLEAAAMALPVVATAIPGCVDAVKDGETGTLVPPRDAKALAGALTTYLNDPALMDRHGRAGRERVLSDFQPEKIWEALYDEYVHLLRSKDICIEGSV